MSKNPQEFIDNFFDELGAMCFPNATESFKEYMEKPLITVTYSRRKTEIDCSIPHKDVKFAISRIIGRLLNIVPEKDRNDVLLHAIRIPTSKKGAMYED